MNAIIRNKDEVFCLSEDLEVWDIDQIVDDSAKDYDRDDIKRMIDGLRANECEAIANRLVAWWHAEFEEWL